MKYPHKKISRFFSALLTGFAAAFVAADASAAVISYTNGQNNVGGIALTDNTTQLSVGGSDSAEQSGVIGEFGGSWGLEKIGTGKLTLSGTNTYTGGTTLSVGTLSINRAANLGAQLSLASSEPIVPLVAAADLGGHIADSGGDGGGSPGGTLIMNGGTLEVTDDVDYTGTLELANGTTSALLVSDGKTLTLSGQQHGNGDTVLHLGDATHTGTIVAAPNGSVFAGGNHTYIDYGTLKAGAINGFTVLYDMTVAAGATLDMNGQFAAIGKLDGGGLVTNSSTSATTLDVSQVVGETFSGTIADGAGVLGLLVNGTGTLTLSGTNTYTGGTTIGSGAVAMTNASSFGTGDITLDGGTIIGAGSGTLANNIILNAGGGTINTDSTGPYGFHGNISGEGALTKTGGLSVEWYGNNTYGGGTFILDGGLIIHNDSNLGTGDVTLNGGGLLILDNTVLTHNFISLGSIANHVVFDDNTTLAGTLSGSGQLFFAMEGDKDITLSGNNSGFTGGFIVIGQQVSDGVYAGGLRISAANNLGSGSLDLQDVNLKADGAFTAANTLTLSFHGASIDTNGHEVTLAGEINGSGGLVKTGTGTLTLTADNTYSGGTAITGGTVAVMHDHALGTGTVSLDGGVHLRINADVTLANNIEINGAYNTLDVNNHHLVLTGLVSTESVEYINLFDDGKITYNGANFGLGLGIKSGEFQVGDENHSGAILTGSVVVERDASSVLSGFGTVVGNVENDATVSPGNGRTIGTLHVTGNYEQGENWADPQSLTALSIHVSPTANALLAIGGTALLNGNVEFHFADGAYTKKRYTFLTASSVTGTFSNVIGLELPGYVFSDVTYAPTAVSFEIAPAAPGNAEVFGAATSTAINNAQDASNTLFDHMNDGNSGVAAQDSGTALTSLDSRALAPSENVQGMNDLAKALPQTMKRYGGWFKGIGNVAALDSKGALAGFSSQMGGFMFGVDRALDKTLRIGAAGGYEHTAIIGNTATTNDGEDNTMRFAIYGSKTLDDGVALNAQGGYALHLMDSERYVTANTSTARASHDAHEFSAGVQAVKTFAMGDYSFSPSLGMNYVYLLEEAYSENGSGIFNTSIAEKDTSSLRFSAGLQVARPMTSLDGLSLTPSMRIRYSYEAADATSNTDVTLLGSRFIASGNRPTRHTLTLGAGLTARINDTLDGFGSYDITPPVDNSFSQTFSAGVKWKF